MISLTKENFDKEVKESEIPVIVDFWASWCMPCKMMSPVFEELSGEYSGKLKFAKLNTDEQSELANQYGITGIPCLIVMEKGKEKTRLVGYMGKDVLKTKIDEAMNA